MGGEGGEIGWLRLLLFLRTEMPALSLLGGPTLQIMAPAFPKVGTGSGSLNCTLFSGAEPVHRSLSPKPFLKRSGLILLTEIDADLVAV